MNTPELETKPTEPTPTTPPAAESVKTLEQSLMEWWQNPNREPWPMLRLSLWMQNHGSYNTIEAKAMRVFKKLHAIHGDPPQASPKAEEVAS